jgi:hypothetical protein
MVMCGILSSTVFQNILPDVTQLRILALVQSISNFNWVSSHKAGKPEALSHLGLYIHCALTHHSTWQKFCFTE